MQLKQLTVSQFLADSQLSHDNYTVFLVNIKESTGETLQVALPETFESGGNWFDLPASAVESAIPLGEREYDQQTFSEAALLLKSDQPQLIEMLRVHFSQSDRLRIEPAEELGDGDVSEPEEAASFGPGVAAQGELSGRDWVNKFPTSKSLLDLKPPFLSKMSKFHNALIAAGASVKISATVRPPERAYLMHWSFKIARQNFDPNDVPAMPGVDIVWAHENEEQSRAAARNMVAAYGIAFAPALTSNHIRGLAVDMTIGWTGTLNIKDATGNVVGIGAPQSGGNPKLQAVGRSYGVIKLVSDPPHWSNDGH
ncbi:MAG: hypothetical protein ABI977_26530 [Acidobacteriota bacterium]